MKTIEVVAAIIQNENKVLATKRGYGEFIDMWEFPGGKIEKDESKIEALKREIKEELNANIIVQDLITTINYDYPHFHLVMHCYFCLLKDNNFTLMEHSDAKWLSKEDLLTVDWLPADVEVIDTLKIKMR